MEERSSCRYPVVFCVPEETREVSVCRDIFPLMLPLGIEEIEELARTVGILPCLFLMLDA